ncbi:MAG: hypothetical protein JNM47_14180 [Hyphomonadaceae bacterium]|nr:hypothetical protein [Hyphomonadaceae bacterium]
MHAMVVVRDIEAGAGGPSPKDVFEYAEAMAGELAGICDQAGASRAAQKFREAAEALRQLPNAAPGDAA